MDDAKIARFWEGVAIGEPDECWLWTRARSPRGYGVFNINARNISASRFVMTLLSERVLERDELACHRCDNPPCCNPAHLWVGQHKENSVDCVQKKRNRNVAKTHCLRGHEYTEANTFRRPSRLNARICGECIREQARAHYARKREASGRKPRNVRALTVSELTAVIAEKGRESAELREGIQRISTMLFDDHAPMLDVAAHIRALLAGAKA